MKKSRLDQSGQGLTEYITLLMLIAVVSISVTKTLGGRVKAKIDEASRRIESEITWKGGSDGGSDSSQ